MSLERVLNAFPASRVPRVGLVSLLWLVVALVSGSVEYVTMHRFREISLLQSLGTPLLASAIWIPMSFGIASAVRRWPFWPMQHFRYVVLHVCFSGVTSFLLNYCWSSVHFVINQPGTGYLPVMANATIDGVRFLHYNAGTYWVIAVLVTLWRRTQSGAGAGGTMQSQDTRLLIKTGTTRRSIPLESIVWIEGAGDYARIHQTDSNHLVGERLRELEARLDPRNFARVHRSAIVNLARIRQLRHKSHGDYEAVMDEGSTVRVTRSRRETISQLLAPNDTQ